MSNVNTEGYTPMGREGSVTFAHRTHFNFRPLGPSSNQQLHFMRFAALKPLYEAHPLQMHICHAY